MTKQPFRELTTDLKSVGELKPIERPGPVATVRGGGREAYLQDGRWLPSWLVRLRRRRWTALALFALALAACGLARLLLARR